MNYETMKRLFDVLVSFLGLIILIPIFVITAILVAIASGFPVFFHQDRLGKNGKVFRIRKLRSMVNNPNRKTSQEIREANPEVTWVGAFIRRTKIDELPQLWNVLKGDLSIVGPRPALPAQLSAYDEIGRKRLMVRPGLTGLAQVNGNTHLSWPERWHYDAVYVESLSFGLDLWIIWRTFAVVFLGEDRFLKRPAVSGKKRWG